MTHGATRGPRYAHTDDGQVSAAALARIDGIVPVSPAEEA